jgi:prepilin-type N-terminal cleavage/methylation domain-containing protein
MVYQINYRKRGFTLVEIVIVIAIFSIFASVSFSSYASFKSKNGLTIAVYDVVDALRNAQSNARKMKEDSKWGVKILSNQAIIFKGASYSSRDSNFDRVLEFSKDVQASGFDEVVFDKINGWASNTGTTTLSGREGDKKIYINEKGTITY